MVLADNQNEFANDGFEKDISDPIPSTKPDTEKKEIKCPEDPEKPNLTLKERFFILKNIGVISLSFCLLFIAYNGISSLQTSINPSIGTTAFSALYCVMILSCIFVPSLMISKLTVKWTIPVSMIGYVAYFVAQYYPTVWTLTPTAMVVGLAAAPMWSSKCTYLNKLGKYYADLTGQDSEVVITRFFGSFFAVFQFSFSIGNLISSAVLTKQGEDKTEEEIIQYCGANFCPNQIDANITLLNPPNPSEVVTIISIYLVCGLLAIIIGCIFIDPLSKFVTEEKETKPIRELLLSTVTRWKNPKQIALIPLTIFSGLEQGFLTTDVTASWVTCGVGVQMVGYTLVIYGIIDGFGSIGLSTLIRYTGRIPVFTFSFILQLTVIIILSSVQSFGISTVMIAVAIWGLSDAVWQTQINALYGVLFPNESESSYSNYRLWESLGFVIMYIADGKLCVMTKIYLLIAFLMLGMVGFIVAEYFERKERK